jgi:ABC-2 type transport system permease protein
MGAALLYEWRRITSIRSTYICSLLFLVATGAVTYLVYQVTSGAAGRPSEQPREIHSVPLESVISAGTNPISIIFLTVIAAMVFGHEYRYGTIRLTLSEFPRRWKVFAAKLLVVSVWILVMLALSFVVAYAVLKVIGAEVDPATDQSWLEIGRSLLAGMGYCTIAFAITLLTRNLVLGVVTPLLLIALIEPLVNLALGDRFTWLPEILPMSAGNAYMLGGEDLLRNGLVFLAWVVGLLVAGFITFERRDA